jgi:predicted nuclease with RNAse H fold
MVAVILQQRELKSELIKLRQNPEYPGLRSLTRRALKYIEKLEKRIGMLEGKSISRQ